MQLSLKYFLNQRQKNKSRQLYKLKRSTVSSSQTIPKHGIQPESSKTAREILFY